jgi:sulfur-carrier protein
MVTLNFYAAARAATGIAEDQFSPASLGEIISAATIKYPQLAAILPGCSYLINGSASSQLEKEIASGDVVDVLPRFAGGA